MGTASSISFARRNRGEAAAIIDGAPAQVDEASTRGSLNIGPTHVCAVHNAVERPHRGCSVARMQIQQFISAVLALHADVDVGIARKVAARSTFAARQLRPDNPDSHTPIIPQYRPA